MLRHAATVVTASRGLSGIAILVMMLFTDQPWAAFWLFAFAMITDLFDGTIARATGGDPQLGALLDPLADKMIIGCCWLALGLRGWAPWWLAGPMLLRDVIVAAIWRQRKVRGVTTLPSKLGQVATSYEGTAIGLLLFHGPWINVHWPSVGVGIGGCALLLSIGSALMYVWDGAVSSLQGDGTGKQR